MIVAWILILHVVMFADLVNILIWLHEVLVLYWMISRCLHLLLTALHRLFKMENLLIDQLFLLLLILGEVLRDRVALCSQIAISFISKYGCRSLHHRHLIFQFILRKLIVFVDSIHIVHIMHSKQSCGWLSMTEANT